MGRAKRGGPARLVGPLAVAMVAVALIAAATLASLDASMPASSGDRAAAPHRADPATGPAADPAREPVVVPSALQPNLRSLPAEDIAISTAPAGRELRFAGMLANEGDGPLEVVPTDQPGCPTGQRRTMHVMYRDVNRSGRYEPSADTSRHLVPTGCMLDHPTHDHWHFDATAGYTLIDPRSGIAVAHRDKVSFCLRDSRRLAGPEWAGRPDHYDDCERADVQGISVGWTDVYKSELPGQKLDLPDDLPDGVYCLRIEADPLGLLQETDETDNASSRALGITGTHVVDADLTECPAG